MMIMNDVVECVDEFVVMRVPIIQHNNQYNGNIWYDDRHTSISDKLVTIVDRNTEASILPLLAPLLLVLLLFAFDDEDNDGIGASLATDTDESPPCRLKALSSADKWVII
jgi:hypothetical protein